MTITLVPFWVVLVTGIVAIVVALTRENAPSGSSFWWFLSYWLTALAILWGGRP